MLPRASSSISVFHLKPSFRAIAFAAAGRAEISSCNALDVRELGETFLAEDEVRHPHPAPNIHVDDGVGVADHVFAVCEPLVQDREMTLGFELIAGMGVVDLFRRKVLEVNGLAEDTGRHRSQQTSAMRATRRDWLAVFSGRNFPVFSAR